MPVLVVGAIPANPDRTPVRQRTLIGMNLLRTHCGTEKQTKGKTRFVCTRPQHSDPAHYFVSAATLASRKSKA